MDVYHNGNFRSGKRGSRLTAVPVQQTFLWEKQELFIPAVYVGEAGAVLDVCARIPVEDMAAFLRKWPRERRLSLKTQEDYEQIDADNPGSQDFLVEMSLDNTPLQLSFSSSICWYPEGLFRMENIDSAPAQEDEWTNDPDAEKLMDAYECSRECGWHFGRLNFNWTSEPILSPQKISLDFQTRLAPVTVGHFTTAVDTDGRLLISTDQTAHLQPAANQPEHSRLSTCQPQHLQPDTDYIDHLPPSANSLKAVHPVTGQEYTLTLHECQQTRHDFSDIGAEDILYPEYCRMLFYSISPEISRDLFDIRDCAEGDKPRKKQALEQTPSASGATAVFMAGKSPVPDRRIAVSSMHFEPVSEIRWRIVFQVRTKPRMEVEFAI